jgi:hypothetical protein
VGDLLLAENFSDPRLLADAQSLLVSRVGRLVTAAHVIESASDRARLAREDGAAAVDMETEWIARACAARKIPMLSLRVISDTVAAPFPVPPAVLFDLERQKTDAFRLGVHLLKHPAQIVRLIRFARQIAAYDDGSTAEQLRNFALVETEPAHQILAHGGFIRAIGYFAAE